MQEIITRRLRCRNVEGQASIKARPIGQRNRSARERRIRILATGSKHRLVPRHLNRSGGRGTGLEPGPLPYQVSGRVTIEVVR